LSFDEDIALRPAGDGVWEGEVRGGWWTPRGPLGGYVMALMLAGFEQAVADPARQPRWLALSVASDAQWQALCGVLGRPAWSAAPDFATLRGRREGHDAIDAQLRPWAAQSELDDQRRRRRRDLAALLTRDPPAEDADARAAAQAAAWRLPQRVAAAACADADLGSIARRLPPDVLAAPLDEVGCLLIPDPDGPGRAASLERAAGRRRLALGPAVPLSELSGSWSLARAALRASEAGVLSENGVLVAEQNLGELLVFEAGALARRIATARLAPLEQLTEKARARMLETARAYVRHQGNSVAMAAAPAGAVIAVEAGRYQETLAPARSVTLVGRCPAQTILAGPAAIKALHTSRATESRSCTGGCFMK